MQTAVYPFETERSESGIRGKMGKRGAKGKGRVPSAAAVVATTLIFD